MARTLDTAEVAIADIVIGERLRPLDDAWVDALASTIATVGQPHPILLGKADRRWLLIDGEHRLEACRRLGRKNVLATRIEANAAERRLMQIDANLIRRNLNALDRATFLAERKAVYEELYPDTRAGVAGGKARQGTASDTMSFAESTAEKIGLSRKSIERAVRIHFQIDPAIRRRIAGTLLADRQSELLALAREGPARQLRIVDMVADGSARSVRAALRAIDGHAALDGSGSADSDGKQLKRLLDAWARASARTRRQFLETLAEGGYRIDAPQEAA